jgi:integrase
MIDARCRRAHAAGLPAGGRLRDITTQHSCLREGTALANASDHAWLFGKTMSLLLDLDVSVRALHGHKARTALTGLGIGAIITRAIQELAGHRDLTTTQRYMHLSPAAVESAIRLLESPAVLPGRGDMLETAINEIGKVNN